MRVVSDYKLHLNIFKVSDMLPALPIVSSQFFIYYDRKKHGCLICIWDLTKLNSRGGKYMKNLIVINLVQLQIILQLILHFNIENFTCHNAYTEKKLYIN